MTGHRGVEAYCLEAHFQDPAVEGQGLLCTTQEIQAKLMDLGWVGRDEVGGARDPFAEANIVRQLPSEDSQRFFEEDVQEEWLFCAVRLAAKHEHLCDQVTSPFRREDDLLNMPMDATVGRE